MTIVLNPSPFDGALREVDLNKIDLFILNEVEGEQITGVQEPVDMIQAMRKKFPEAKIVLTLGEDGAIYADQKELFVQTAFSVSAVDTTAAGDTFTGYFLAGLAEGMPVPEIMRMSAMASAIAVTQSGAVPSIPWREEVEDALAKL